MGGGARFNRQVTLYSRLGCAQKCQNCKFDPRFLSMIVENNSTQTKIQSVTFRIFFISLTINNNEHNQEEFYLGLLLT